MVLAQGDNGRELVPAHEAVEIQETPLGADNIVVPATVRWLSELRGGGVPTKIRSITATDAGAYVTFDCTPKVQYVTDNGPVYLHWSGCTVRDMKDAQDPIFDGLPAHDRAQLFAAVGAEMTTKTEFNPERGPVAMGTYDSSVYLAWIETMAEVLSSVSPKTHLPGEVAASYGGLMMALSEAAKELMHREIREFHERQPQDRAAGS